MSKERGPSTAQLEVIRAQVLGEIAEFKGGIVPYLNNFKNWLRPAHLEKDMLANYRWMITSRLNPAKPHRDQMSLGDKTEDHSKVWLNDTPVSFVKAIDQAMNHYGITAEEVHRIDMDANEDPIIGDMKHLMLAVYILKPFIWLRGKGYTRRELIA